MASLHWWINQEISFSPKQMAQLIIKLVGSNHLKVLGIQIKAYRNVQQSIYPLSVLLHVF